MSTIKEAYTNLPRPVGYATEAGRSPNPAPIDHSHRIEVEDWKSLELQNDWIDYEGEHPPARYLLDPVGFVHLEASLKDGTITDGTTIASLPIGYRPKYKVPFVGYGSTGVIFTGEIRPDGDILGLNGLDATFTTFSAYFEADRNVFAQNRS